MTFKDFKGLLIHLVMISYVQNCNLPDLPALREVKLLAVELFIESKAIYGVYGVSSSQEKIEVTALIYS